MSRRLGCNYPGNCAFVEQRRSIEGIVAGVAMIGSSCLEEMSLPAVWVVRSLLGSGR